MTIGNWSHTLSGKFGFTIPAMIPSNGIYCRCGEATRHVERLHGKRWVTHFLRLCPRVKEHVACCKGPPSASPRPFYCISSVLRKARRRSGRRVAPRSFFRCREENGTWNPWVRYLPDALDLGLEH